MNIDKYIHRRSSEVTVGNHVTWPFKNESESRMVESMLIIDVKLGCGMVMC